MRLLTEKIKKQLHQPWFGGGVGAIATMLFGFCLFLFPFGKGLQDWSYDLPFLVRSEKPIDDVVIIYLDETTYSDLNQEPATFDRRLHADLLKRLQAEGARLVVFDVLFIDKKRPVTDSEHAFAKAMKAYGKVVIGAQYTLDEHVAASTSVWPPIDLLRDAAAGWGLVKIDADPDFGARRHHSGTETVPSMAWRAVEVVGGEVTKNPKNRFTERWINYYAPEPFLGFSYAETLPGKKLPEGFSFRDKYVFVGSGDVASYTGDKRRNTEIRGAG